MPRAGLTLRAGGAVLVRFWARARAEARATATWCVSFDPGSDFNITFRDKVVSPTCTECTAVSIALENSWQQRYKEKDGGEKEFFLLIWQTLYARPFKYCFPGSSSAAAVVWGWRGRGTEVDIDRLCVQGDIESSRHRTHLAEVGTVALTGSLGGGNLVGAAGGGGATEGDVGAGRRDLSNGQLGDSHFGIEDAFRQAVRSMCTTFFHLLLDRSHQLLFPSRCHFLRPPSPCPSLYPIQ